MTVWRELTLADLVAEAGGDIQTGPFGSQLHAADYVLDGTPVVMPQNIGANRIDPAGIARVSQEDMDRLRRYWLTTGDIVYSRRGDVERRALVRPENDGWLCGTGCLRVRIADHDVHDPTFISYALGESETRAWITRHAVGATMLNLNTSILGAVPLRIPTIDEQRAIAEVLGALDDKIAANDRLVATSAELGRQLLATAPARCEVADLASLGKRTLRPEQFDDVVAHYSLPAYDAGGLPALHARESIKSNKQPIDGPVTLVSKLNPRIPRVWDIPAVPEQMAVASTEFVVLQPRGVSTSELAAALSLPTVARRLAERVSGTSGSHQRVKPHQVLELQVPDPRSLADVTRKTLRLNGLLAARRRVESRDLAALRDTLLPALMSGRLTVKEAETTVSEAI